MIDQDKSAFASDASGPSRFPRRRTLWGAAAFAGLVMTAAAWQLTQPTTTAPSAPTASEAFNADAGELADGDAPGFTVPLRGGGEFDLGEHLRTDRRPILLNLWASWCIPCRNEMPLLDELAPSYESVLFLGVAVNDSRDNAEAFADEIGVTYPIAYDTEGTVVDGYPAPAMPVTYVVSADGVVTDRYFGELDAGQIAELLGGVD